MGKRVEYVVGELRHAVRVLVGMVVGLLVLWLALETLTRAWDWYQDHPVVRSQRFAQGEHINDQFGYAQGNVLLCRYRRVGPSHFLIDDPQGTARCPSWLALKGGDRR